MALLTDYGSAATSSGSAKVVATQGSGLTSGKAGRIRGVQGKPHPSPHLSMQDPLHTCPPSDFSTDLIARSAPACSVRFALLLRAAYPTPQNLNKSLWFFASPQDTAGYATSFNHSVTGVWSAIECFSVICKSPSSNEACAFICFVYCFPCMFLFNLGCGISAF